MVPKRIRHLYQAMATLTIKNMPDDLYRKLKRKADRHRRSINSEAIVCLERSLGSEPVDSAALLARAREVRTRMPGVYVTDADLRAARDEGRP